MPRINPGPPCSVCSKPSVAQNLCSTHYTRLRVHGHLEQIRPDTWGKQNGHPLKDKWRQTRKCKEGRDPRWDDFWVFVEDVGVVPEGNFQIKRLYKTRPWGPDNFRWNEILTAGVDRSTREARNAEMRAWRNRNKLRAKGYDLKKVHGISLAHYEQMLHDQGGGCAICGGQDEHFRLAVDHCHDGGGVRGLLCSKCNRGLGLFCDRPERLEAAASYLRKARGVAKT